MPPCAPPGRMNRLVNRPLSRYHIARVLLAHQAWLALRRAIHLVSARTRKARPPSLGSASPLCRRTKNAPTMRLAAPRHTPTAAECIGPHSAAARRRDSPAYTRPSSMRMQAALNHDVVSMLFNSLKAQVHSLAPSYPAGMIHEVSAVAALFQRPRGRWHRTARARAPAPPTSAVTAAQRRRSTTLRAHRSALISYRRWRTSSRTAQIPHSLPPLSPRKHAGTHVRFYLA